MSYGKTAVEIRGMCCENWELPDLVQTWWNDAREKLEKALEF